MTQHPQRCEGMTEPHMKRCNNCQHYDKFFGSCKLTWYHTSIQGHKETIHPKTDGAGAWLISRVGCASHSSANRDEHTRQIERMEREAHVDD
jgi:hypothetical protein